MVHSYECSQFLKCHFYLYFSFVNADPRESPMSKFLINAVFLLFSICCFMKTVLVFSLQ